jgi:hypothetical protein
MPPAISRLSAAEPCCGLSRLPPCCFCWGCESEGPHCLFSAAAGGQILSSSLKHLLKRVRPEFASPRGWCLGTAWVLLCLGVADLTQRLRTFSARTLSTDCCTLRGQVPGTCVRLFDELVTLVLSARRSRSVEPRRNACGSFLPPSRASPGEPSEPRGRANTGQADP